MHSQNSVLLIKKSFLYTAKNQENSSSSKELAF